MTSNEIESTDKKISVAEKLWATIKYFKPQEFDSPDDPGSGLGMNIEFIKILDQMRGEAGFAFKVHSGVRSIKQNTDVGGVRDSAHEKKCASDIGTEDHNQRFVIVKLALKYGIKRIGIGETFVHLDIDMDKPQEVVWLYKSVLA